MGFTRIPFDAEGDLPAGVHFKLDSQHPWLEHVSVEISAEDKNRKCVYVAIREDIPLEQTARKFQELLAIKTLYEPRARRGELCRRIDEAEAVMLQDAGAGSRSDLPAIVIFETGEGTNISDVLRAAKIPDDIRDAVLQELRGKEHGGRS